MNLKNWFKQLTVRAKLTFFFTIVLIVIYGLSALILQLTTSKRLLKETSDYTYAQMQSFSDVTQLVLSKHGNQLNANSKIELRTYFDKKLFFESGFPFLVSDEGDILLHPFKEGENIKDTYFFNKIKAGGNLGDFGFTEKTDEGKSKRYVFYKKIEDFNAFLVISIYKKELFKDINSNKLFLALAVFVILLLTNLVINFLIKPIVSEIKKISNKLSLMSEGIIVEKAKYAFEDELGDINRSFNKLADGIAKTAVFAEDIGKENYQTEFKPLGDQDKLGNALLGMRDRLKASKDEDLKRKEEEYRRNWSNEGLAKFGEILRSNYESLEELSIEILSNLVDYLDASQGGLFSYNEDDVTDPHLQLMASIAYNRKKFKQKIIKPGEGLVGICALEKESINLKEIPNDYVEITSGLGGANPTNLLIVTLKVEANLFGVIELASFKEFTNHQIQFVEKIAESIASTLSSVKINLKTAALLEQSQQQAEEMAAQEEEMRQNMEELQATQEESSRREEELGGLLNVIDKTFLSAQIDAYGVLIHSNQRLQSMFEQHIPDMHGESLQDLMAIGRAPIDFEKFWNDLRNGKNLHLSTSLSLFEKEMHLNEYFMPIMSSDDRLLKVLYIAFESDS